jgi:diguanylate cyclase (GGDEF)-like protein/PAS domain S-box-containing protein
LNNHQDPDFRLIAERSSDGYFRYLLDNGLVYVNPGFSALLGRPHEELVHQSQDLLALIHSDDLKEYQALLDRVSKGQVAHSVAVIQMVKADKSPVWVELFAVPVTGGDEEIIGIDGLVRDVSEHLQVADLLSRRSLELAALLDAQKVLAASLDYEATIQSIVQQAKQLLEAKLSIVFLPEPRTNQLQPQASAGSISIPTDDLRFMVGEGVSGWVMAKGESQRVDKLSADPRGKRLMHRLESDVSLLAVPLKIGETIAGTLTVVGEVHQYEDDSLDFLEALAQVASLALANSRDYRFVEHKATIDGLTGAHNRLFLEENLPIELERADRLGYSMALMMVDVDDLKGINDTHGHLQGDQVLCKLVSVLRKNSRETDWVARYGGDEFVVVLPGCPVSHLERLGENIQRAISEDPDDFTFSVSIGGTVRNAGAGGASELLRAADKAERTAKEYGGASMHVKVEE